MLAFASADELLSDGFDPKLVDDTVYEVDCKMIAVGDENIDIGANPSAEEQEEALENGAEMKNNVVHSFRLQPTSFDKKSYLTYLKGYMKKVKAELEKSAASGDEAAVKARDTFEARAQAFAKKIIGNWKDYECFVGEGMDPEGMVVLMNYREDGVTPYMLFWKDGMKEVSRGGAKRTSVSERASEARERARIENRERKKRARVEREKRSETVRQDEAEGAPGRPLLRAASERRLFRTHQMGVRRGERTSRPLKDQRIKGSIGQIDP